MKLNQQRAKIVYFSGSGSLLTDHSSGAFLREITRAALLAIVLGISVLFATGCASTGKKFSARLISLVTPNQQAEDAENDIYKPARSPVFSDLFGS